MLKIIYTLARYVDDLVPMDAIISAPYTHTHTHDDEIPKFFDLGI